MYAGMNLNTIPQDFILAKEVVYDKCSFKCSVPIMEDESTDYGACSFTLNGFVVRYRVAKITPAKTG